MCFLLSSQLKLLLELMQHALAPQPGPRMYGGTSFLGPLNTSPLPSASHSLLLSYEISLHIPWAIVDFW